MVGGSINARCYGGSSPRAAFRWVLNALQACGHDYYRHTNKVSETDTLPVGHVADERVDGEAISDFPDQLAPCSLRLFIGCPGSNKNLVPMNRHQQI
jgi:hypothetical protein